MTPKQQYLRRNLLAKIHQVPFVKQSKELEMWEEYLLNSYGVSSCANLSIDELRNLLDVLSGRTDKHILCGARPKDKSQPTRITTKQMRYIEKLWNLSKNAQNLTPLSNGLFSFCSRQLGHSPLYINHLSSKEANKLITGSEYLFNIKHHKSNKETPE